MLTPDGALGSPELGSGEDLTIFIQEICFEYPRPWQRWNKCVRNGSSLSLEARDAGQGRLQWSVLKDSVKLGILGRQKSDYQRVSIYRAIVKPLPPAK